MTWDAVAAIAAIIGVAVTVLMGAYNSGRFKQQLDSNLEMTRAHGVRLDEHGRAIGELEISVGQFDKWTEGYNAASRVSASREPNPIL